MVSSNAYIATDGETLMKVGKANNPKRREKQIDLTITLTVACLDEVSAYRIEDQLRQFIIERGGIKYASTVDWFAFDPQIYRMVCEFAANLDGFTPISDMDSQDAEIEVLRRRYLQLLTEERKVDVKENPLKLENEKLLAEAQKLRETYGYLEEKYEQLKQELQQERQEKYRFLREAGYWEGVLIGIKKSLKDSQDPIDLEKMLNTLDRLIPDKSE